MKKKWIAGCAAAVVFSSACGAFWMGKPALTQQLGEVVTTTANSKINGTVDFSSLDISMTGVVCVYDPVIRDDHGRIVMEGKELDVRIDPLNVVPALWRDAPLEVLDTIDIYEPVVHLWENSDDGRWNAEKLIKESQDQRSADFRGVLRLHDGTVRAALGGETIVLTDADGTVSFSDYPDAVDIAADMALDGKALSLSGTYTSSRKYDFTVRAEEVKAVYAAPFIPESMDITLLGGAAENVRVRAADGRDGLFLSGQADISGGSASVYGLAVDNLSGRAVLSTEDIRLKDVSGTVNGQAFSAGGLIKTNGSTPVFNLSVHVPGASLDAFADKLDLPVSGSVGFDGTVWGTAEHAEGRGKASFSHIDYDGAVIDDGTADVSYIDGVARFDQAELHGAGGTVRGSGAYDGETGGFEASIQAEGIDLSRIPQVPVSVLGVVSAHVQAAGNSQSGDVRLSGTVSGDGLSCNGVAADHAEGTVAYAGGTVTVSDVVIQAGGGLIQGGGTYDTAADAPDFAFTADHVALDILQPVLPVPVRGTVSAAGRIYGAGWQWEASVSASDGSVQHMDFDTIDGTMTGVGRHIDIPALYWRYVDGVHTVSGTVDLDGRTVDAEIRTDHMRLEKLLPAIGQGDLPMTGWADNVVSITGSLDDPRAEGTFHLTSGSYAGYLYKNISADYRYDGGRLYIMNGDISSYTASLAVSGSVGETLDLDVEGRELDIARLMPRTQLPRSGIFNLTAHIGGTPANPTARGALRADTITINHMPLSDVRGDFAYYDNMIRLTDLHFAQSGGSYDGNLLYRTGDGWMRGRASVTAGDLGSMIQLAGAPLQQVQGRIDGEIRLEGTAADPAASITGKITEASLAGQAVEPADIDIQVEKDTIKVNSLALKTSGGGMVAARGTYAFHGPVDMQVGARSFPSRILLAITGNEDIDVDTPIDFAAKLGGTGDDVEADVSAQLNGGAINGVSFTNGFAMLNIRSGNIHINQVSLTRDPYKVTASGDVPVSALSGGRGAEPMNVTVKLDNAGLDVLTFMTPQVASAQGAIEGALQIGGTLAKPEVRGSFGVENGTIQFRDVTYPLDGITGTITFDGNAASVDIQAVMDKKGAADPGKITVQGDVAWDGWKLTKYIGHITADRLALDCDYYNGPVNGQIELSEGRFGPKISGSVTVDNAVVDIPLSFSDSTAPPDAELDVSVTLGNKVRLYNRALYDLMVYGSARFRGSTLHPMPSGRFEVQRGVIHYLDTNFRINKARADFNQIGSFLPVIDLEGTSRVGQYGVLLTLKGPADNMDMILRSDPPLTKQQIISLITLRNSTGKQQSSLSGEDAGTLLGSGLRMTLNSLGITQELEKMLSLDMFTVTNGSLDFNDKNADVSNNYYNIEMGKYLFNNFMVTAAFGLNHDDNRYGAQFDLGSKFSLNAWASDDDSFAGGLYRYSFY